MFAAKWIRYRVLSISFVLLQTQKQTSTGNTPGSCIGKRIIPQRFAERVTQRCIVNELLSLPTYLYGYIGYIKFNQTIQIMKFNLEYDVYHLYGLVSFTIPYRIK